MVTMSRRAASSAAAAILVVVLGVVHYAPKYASSNVTGSSESIELRKLREEIHQAFDTSSSNGVMIGIAGPLEERFVGSSHTLRRELFFDDLDDEDEIEIEGRGAKQPQGRRGGKGGGYLPKGAKGSSSGSSGSHNKGAKGGSGGYLPKRRPNRPNKGAKGGSGGYLPKRRPNRPNRRPKDGSGSGGGGGKDRGRTRGKRAQKGAKGGGGGGHYLPKQAKGEGHYMPKRGQGKMPRQRSEETPKSPRAKKASIFEPESDLRRRLANGAHTLFGGAMGSTPSTNKPGRKLFEANKDGSIPFVDGSATVFRRDSTPLNVVEAFFPTALSESNGLFGYYWNPKDNTKIAQCAYPIDAYTLCRGSSATGEDMVADRCSKMIDCHDERVNLPSTITQMEPFMCDEEESFHANMLVHKQMSSQLRSVSTNGSTATSPSCIQQMLDKKKNTPEYRSFSMDVPWAPTSIEDYRADMSYTEVVINREQDIYSGADVADEEMPRAAGWVWVHAGPNLWTMEQLASRGADDVDDEAETVRNLLCGLYHWDSDMWQATERGLEQPQYLLQMVSSYGFAGDKKTEDIFDVLDLARLCQ